MRLPLLKKITALVMCVTLLSGALCIPAAAGTVLLGDLDNDAHITTEDARFALRVALELTEATEDIILVGDIDGNGYIDTEDARLILRAALELDDLEGRTVEANPDPYAFCAPLPTEIPPAPETDAPSGTFTFTVYGRGHCVGLSQYGAIIMAQAGYPYDYILSYYYSGTKLVKDKKYPKTTRYGGEGEVDTYELLCRIVSMEIGGAASEPEALKAQAVAVFTLMEYFDFRPAYRSNIGEATGSFENCSEEVRSACKEVIGKYLTMLGDKEKKPVLTVYGSMVAGRTLSAEEVWGAGNFPVSVSSPFEASLPNFVTTYVFTEAEIRSKIEQYLPSAKLPKKHAKWFRITKHDASLDADRGYVYEIKVGDQVLTGLGALTQTLRLGLCSPCYTVTYTP